jgi:choline-glycine betaine transporter
MDMNKFNLQRFIISVVIIGVVLVVGIYITDSIGQTVRAENTAATVTNETGAYVNSTGYTLALATADSFGNPVITAAWNATDDGPIGLGNITVSGAGVVTNATATEWSDVIVSYTYTYTADTDASDAASDVVDALATGTSWISILVVVGFAVIILTMLTSGLGTAARREDEVPYY